jgi:serine/threonine protein kinase
MKPKQHRDWIRIRGRDFEVWEQLSLPNRGRWKIRDPEPLPKGTMLAAILLPSDTRARQLLKSYARIPSSHSNLPRLVTSENRNGTLSMVVTWCEGIDVASYLDAVTSGRWKRPSASEVVRRFKSLAYSLAVLHNTCRIVHGDIKPPNLIFPNDPGSMAMIDFGSSWQMERTATRDLGDGTDEYYSAPEVFLELPKVDARADQFSAAVVLYEMLTLKLPYAGLGGKAGHPGYEDAASRFVPPSAHISDREQIPPSILKQIDQVLETALQLEPNHRFPTTMHFAKALDAICLNFKIAESESEHKEESFWQTLHRWTFNTDQKKFGNPT